MQNEFNANVFFADSRQIDKLLPEKSVDLVLAGPPYWNEVVYSDDIGQLSTIDEYSEFLFQLSKCWSGCAKIMKDGSILVVWVHDLLRKSEDSYRYIPFHLDIIRTFPGDLALKNIYIWDRYLNKDKGDINTAEFDTRVQYVLILKKRGVSQNEEKIKKSLNRLYWQPIWHKKTSPRLLGSGWFFRVCRTATGPFSRYFKGFKKVLKKSGLLKDDYEFNDYMTECPRDIADHLIKMFSSPGDIVLDPFAGSGTTLQSAMSLRRKCIGVEINKNTKVAIQKKLNNRVTFK